MELVSVYHDPTQHFYEIHQNLSKDAFDASRHGCSPSYIAVPCGKLLARTAQNDVEFVGMASVCLQGSSIGGTLRPAPVQKNLTCFKVCQKSVKRFFQS